LKKWLSDFIEQAVFKAFSIAFSDKTMLFCQVKIRGSIFPENA